MSMSLKDQVAEIIKKNPGLTSKEIYQYFPHISYFNVSGVLSHLYYAGDYMRQPVSGTKLFRYYFSSGAEPEARSPQKRRPKLTDAGLNARLAEANKTIADLEEWKVNAIKRFPDLAVAPVIIRAREIVAKRLELSGDGAGAREVRAGKRDNTMIMLATIDALETMETMQ